MNKPRPIAYPRRKWWHLRWLDGVGILGIFLLVPQVILWVTEGRAAEPTLAGIGLTLVLAASGGSRVADSVARTMARRMGTGLDDQSARSTQP